MRTDKFQEIIDKYKAQGKFRVLDRPEDIEGLERLRKAAAQTKREYHIKEASSRMKASRTLLR